MVDALSPTMTLRDFENGYWYLEQLKNFAERIGIPAAKKLRTTRPGSRRERSAGETLARDRQRVYNAHGQML